PTYKESFICAVSRATAMAEPSSHLEEHEVDEAPVLEAVAEPRSRRMPILRLKQDQAVEAHRHGHRMLPLRSVTAFLDDDIAVQFAVGGIAQRIHFLGHHRHSVGAGSNVSEEFGSSGAVF